MRPEGQLAPGPQSLTTSLSIISIDFPKINLRLSNCLVRFARWEASFLSLTPGPHKSLDGPGLRLDATILLTSVVCRGLFCSHTKSKAL